MRMMRLLGGALGWVFGVAAIATLASIAINSAGQQVVARTITVGQSDGLGPVTPTTGPSSTGQSPSANLGPALGPTTATSGRPTTATSSSSSSTTTTPGTSPTTSRTTTKAPTTTRPAPSPTVQPVSDLRVTSGGAVWVECTGGVVTDALAQPNDAWVAHTGHHGPGDLEVQFTRSSNQIQVTVVCTGGQPRFTISSGSSHGDD